MLKIGSWNIRGLNSPHKQKEVSKLIFDQQLDIVCLVETKVRRKNLCNVKNNYFLHWDLIDNFPLGGVLLG